MTKLNLHFQKLSAPSLFPDVEQRIEALQKKTPHLLDLSIGDVSSPLFPNVIEALKRASTEMGDKTSFRGYGPAQGYLFLREAIAKEDYKNQISPEEIFISDGASSDLADLQEIFAIDNRVAVLDPSYPIYVEANVLAGRTRPLLKTGRYGGVTYLSCLEDNQFQPELPNTHVDLIYLASPNNPTGVALTRDTLSRFVTYAKQHNAVILYDGSYEAFIQSDAPRSIYEIEGAKEVAIEVRSFSKSAGFTGLRCSYTVIPHELKVRDAGSLHALHPFWKRRVETKTNGVSYPIQKAALALYTSEGRHAIRTAVLGYMEQTKILLKGLKSIGYTVYGGMDAPYLWHKTPPKISSWEFFDFLLESIQVATLPGAGFGPGGVGFVRLSGLVEPHVIQETLYRFKALA